MNVLVVDDDEDVRRVVRRALEREDFAVLESSNGDEAVRAASTAAIDVVILDLHLPDTSGLELLPRLRDRRPGVYVVMLTGAGSEADRVLGLVSGADDYLVKPFSARELAARLIAVRRRERDRRPGVVEVGGVRVDLAARAVTLGGEPLELTRREFDLLGHLVANPRRTLTRGELLEAVWGSSAEWQSDKTVTEHIRRLRSKIELDPVHPVRIVSVRGVGYRFDPDGPPSATSTSDARGRGASSADANVVVRGAAIVAATPEALLLIGAERPEQVIGRDILEFVAPQSIGAVEARRETEQLGRSPRPEVITLMRLGGDEMLVEIATMAVPWAGEQATQVTMWDITGDSSKLRELAIGIRSDVGEAIVITDAQLRIQSFSPAAEVLYGWREDEVVGRTTFEALPWLRDDLQADAIRSVLQRGGRWHGTVSQRRRDGATVTVRSSVTLLRDHGGQPVGVVAVNRPIDPATGQRARDRSFVDAALASDIRRGIESGEFAVHYQPIVSLVHGTRVGMEALLRWQHPERGVLSPRSFIDVAERSGAILDLGEFVFDTACRHAAAWQRAGHDLYVSVNLSARQLSAAAVFDRLTESLGRTALSADRLCLEITETALVEDLGQASQTLHRLAALGVRLAIDDFGTGWSSLTYLREFPISSLKIDRVFVDGVGANSADTAIVTSILSLGRELDLSVVAEGIETDRQRDHLRDLGCELGQGYLFGRPGDPTLLGLPTDE